MMIGLAILVGMGGMITSLQKGFGAFLDKSMGADYIILPESLLLGGGNVGAGAGLADQIRNTPGMGMVTTVRVATTRSGSTDLQVVGLDPTTFTQVSGLDFSQGNAADAFSALDSGRTLIANSVFTLQTGAKVGQDITLQTPDGPLAYRVVAVGVDFMNVKLATGYISQANLARDFHVTSDVMIMADRAPGANAAAVTASLSSLVKNYPIFTLYTAEDIKQVVQENLISKMGILYYVLIFLAVPSLIALINTLVINVLERTREIGMLRAVGATRPQIRRIILGESLLLSAIGIAFGLLSGLWLSYVIVGGLSLMGLPMTFYFPTNAIVSTIAVGLVFGALAAVLPARQAARLDIVTALQYE